MLVSLYHDFFPRESVIVISWHKWRSYKRQQAWGMWRTCKQTSHVISQTLECSRFYCFVVDEPIWSFDRILVDGAGMWIPRQNLLTRNEVIEALQLTSAVVSSASNRLAKPVGFSIANPNPRNTRNVLISSLRWEEKRLDEVLTRWGWWSHLFCTQHFPNSCILIFHPCSLHSLSSHQKHLCMYTSTKKVLKLFILLISFDNWEVTK